MPQGTTDQLPDVVPLTSAERQLKARLEEVIRSGFAEFMRVAEALSEIRRRRLYRECYVGFADYVRGEFALALSSATSIINSFELAQGLIADGVRLPRDITPTAVRPLAMLPNSEGLRTSCWQFVQSLSPSRCPSTTLVSRVARLIRAELDVMAESEEGDSDNADAVGISDNAVGIKGRPCGPSVRRLSDSPLPREEPFLRPVVRLATFQSFNVSQVVASVPTQERAATTCRICEELIGRLRLVQDCLRTSFPDIKA
jgi:hypothetical protein